MRRRRRGKALRGCIVSLRETKFGMAGRIDTFQDQPFERPTNYAALVAMRCNVDVQDMSRVLPPRMWHPKDELETEAVADACEADCDHGAFPQRLKSFSLGARPNWGWMKFLGITEHRSHALLLATDRPGIFEDLLRRPNMHGQ